MTDNENILKNHTFASFEVPFDENASLENALDENSSNVSNDDQELTELEKLTKPKELLTKETPEGFTETERPQKKSPSEKRVKQALYNAKIAKEREMQMANELAETKRLLAEKEHLLTKKDELVNTYYDSNSATREASIKNALRQAKLDGDIDAEIELSDQLATLKAEKMTNEYHKYQKATAPVYQQSQQNYQNDFIDEPIDNTENYNDLDDPVSDWKYENSSIFENPNLTQEFLKRVVFHENKLTLNGQIRNVDPIDILNQAKNDLEHMYNVNPQQTNQQQTNQQQFNSQPSYQNRSNVAPVPRAGTMAEQYVSSNGGGNRITLTADQKRMINEIARTMPHKSQNEIIKNFAYHARDAQNLENPYQVKFIVEDY